MNKQKAFIRKEKGVALLMALFSIGFLVFIAIEIAFDSSVYFSRSSQRVNILKAKYAAKAGIRVSLLRLWIFKQIKLKLKNIQGFDRVMDKVWNVPFAWPASKFLPEIKDNDSGSLIKGIEDIEKKSLMTSNYIVSIHPLSQKINLNLLAFNNPKVTNLVMDFLKKITLNLISSNEALSEKYNEETVIDILNNIKDWVDPDKVTVYNETESSLYSNSPIPLPLNRPFKTPKEILMVSKVTSDFLKIINPYASIHGGAQISINYVKASFFNALSQEKLDKETLDSIFYDSNSLEDNPIAEYYSNSDQLIKSLENKGIDKREGLEKILAPLSSYDAPSNFIIKSVGESGDSSVEITVTVVDPQKFTTQIQSILEFQSEKKKKKGASTSLPERPLVVSWEEN